MILERVRVKVEARGREWGKREKGERTLTVGEESAGDSADGSELVLTGRQLEM